MKKWLLKKVPIDKNLSDITFEDDKLIAISRHDPSKTPGDFYKTWDGSESIFLPSPTDIHVHLREPGQTHKETISTGTKCAVAGGFTSIVTMANTKPPIDSPEIVHGLRKEIQNRAHCEVGIMGAVSKDLAGTELSEIALMARAGVCSLSDDGVPLMNSRLMRDALITAAQWSLPIVVHAEDYYLSGGSHCAASPQQAKMGLRGNHVASEAILIFRDLQLLMEAGGKIHFAHLSTKMGVDLVRDAKRRGLNVTAEVTPHHVLFSKENIYASGLSPNLKMAPPLRDHSDRLALIEALNDGTIDCFATDHAPHADYEKVPFFGCSMNGILGLETALSSTFSLVLTGELPQATWVKLWTTGPRAALPLAPTSPDSFSIFSPSINWIHSKSRSRSTNSPWIGQTFQGKNVLTCVKGQVRYVDETMPFTHPAIHP